MPTLAIAVLGDLALNADVVDYLNKVDATLAPFQGRFLVHGARAENLEGEWFGQTVIIAFPDRETARAWYWSEAYQAILPLRLRNADCTAMLIDTVGPGYRAAALGEYLQAALASPDAAKPNP